MYMLFCFFFFFKQKTAYEMRISDWSSDVCSSDLGLRLDDHREAAVPAAVLETPFHHPAARHGIDGDEASVDGDRLAERHGRFLQIGRASCRERVCQYV